MSYQIENLLMEMTMMKELNVPLDHPYLIKQKRELRRLQKKDDRVYDDGCEIYVVEGKSFDAATLKAVLPERIRSLDSAEEYFLDELYRECMPSQYDCTGQKFTAWYHIGKLAGRFVVYYRECLDV